MRRHPPGELALVLHTHMPYVTGFGTWPFGEEWLWEAIATSYLPLLDVLGRAPITLSLTPVLCDQLEEPGATERCLRFLREVRPESHERDVQGFRETGQDVFVSELKRSAGEYVAAAERLESLRGGLLAALGKHASWTSAATHAVLPLLATDNGIELQLQTGVDSHRRRFGGWEGGFWLPECAHAWWLHPLLEQVGVRSTCIELTKRWGIGDPRHLRPLRTVEGPVLWPIDRQIIALVWSATGYPASAAYRNYHGLTFHHHRVWRNDGQPYDPEQAALQAAAHARDFVGRARARVADGGVCVCALDTELLGHWWYEGVTWLDAVIEECARQELALTCLGEDALERHEAALAPPDLDVSSWGEGGDLRTWSSPPVADLAWQARNAELALASARKRPSERALREVLALQSSDWAFLVYRGLAADYPRQRASGHFGSLMQALDGQDGGPDLDPELRNLAPELNGWEG